MTFASLLLAVATALGAVGVWPVTPHEIVRGFDPPVHDWDAGHRGVDLAAPTGTTVRTALPGTVSFVGSIAGVPNVVVSHGATRTTYQPVIASVRRGDVLAASDPIGRLATLGGHCLPRACLHWGLIEGRDHYLDPLTLVGGVQQIRLLPMIPATPALVEPAGVVRARAHALGCAWAYAFRSRSPVMCV
ncbi:MAG: M23 family metallopeptidase [Pirellulales bacterium]